MTFVFFCYMSKVYCGAKKVPKGYTTGSEAQCKSQIRLFGQQKVSNPVYNSLLTSGLQPIYCGAHKTKRVHGTKAQCTQKGQIRKYGLFTLNSLPKSKTKSPTKSMEYIIDSLTNTYKKMEKQKKGGKPRYTYQELFYVYMVHNPGKQHFDNIVGNLFGKKTMITTISNEMKLHRVSQIKTIGLKSQYKGHSYELNDDYVNYAKPDLMFITSDELYKMYINYRYNVNFLLI